MKKRNKVRVGDLHLHLIVQFDDVSKEDRKIVQHYVYINQCVGMNEYPFTDEKTGKILNGKSPKMESVLSGAHGAFYHYFKITKKQANELLSKGFKISGGF